MNTKRTGRFRRARRTREHIKRLGIETGVARLCLTRSIKHITAQVIAPQGGKILACASSLEPALRKGAKEAKVSLAQQVGKLLAERAKEAGVNAVASDRSGYRYHGRVAALIQSARDNGLVV